MKEYQIIRGHLLGGLEGGAWGGVLFSAHMLFQFGGYLHGYLLLTLWCAGMGGIIGGIIGVLYVKCLPGLGTVGRAMIGGGCVVLADVLFWLTGLDNGGVTALSRWEALLRLTEGVLLLGVLPGVMSGAERNKAD